MQVLLENCSENKEKWLELRKGKIGASSAYDAADIDANANPLDAWLELMGLKEPLEDNDSMYFGRELESFAANEFAKRYANDNPGADLRLERADMLVQHPKYHFASCTPDYFLFVNGEKCNVQIKTTKSHNLSQWEDGACPNRVRAQCLHEMGCLPGVHRSFAAAFIFEPAFRYCEIPRQEEFIDELFKREAALYALYEKREPPPIKKAYASEMKALFWDYEVDEVILEPKHEKLFIDYLEAKGREDRAKEERSLLGAKIMELGALKDGAKLITCGEHKATIVRQEFDAIDTKKWREQDKKGYYSVLKKYTNEVRKLYPLVSKIVEKAPKKK